MTAGFRLRARFVVHTVGPVWRGGTRNEPTLLTSCYRESLELAVAHGIRSIAFPAISCGVYGYPLDDACKIAVHEVVKFLAREPSIENVTFVCFGNSVLKAYQKALEAE